MIDPSTPIHVVIPAYNEARKIGTSVRAIGAHLAGRRPGSTICVVDDGSTDDTATLAREAGEALPEGVGFRLLGGPPNRGKGHAVRQGALRAEAPLVLFIDADLSTPIEEMDKLVDALASGADLAIGSRALPGASVDQRQPLYRTVMGKTFNKIMWLFTQLPLADTQCGFKIFRREAAERLFGAATIDRFAFDVELLFLAHRAGLRIAQVPIHWSDDAESSVHPVLDSAQMVRDLARIRWIHRKTRV